jgi:hypothetical protein
VAEPVVFAVNVTTLLFTEALTGDDASLLKVLVMSVATEAGVLIAVWL